MKPTGDGRPKQRVLFVINSLEGGGAERVFAVVLDHIAPYLHDVQIEIALLDDRPSRFEIHAPFVIHHLRGSGGLLDSTKRLYRLLAQFRPDVVVSFLTRANYLTAAFARRLGYKAIISERSDTNGRLGGGLAGYLKKALVRRLYPRAAYVIAVAEGIKDSLIREYGVARDAARVIYNPYDMSALRHRAQENCDLGDGPFILTVGRLVRAKRFDLLIRAYARGQFNQDLVIAGEGPELANLQALALELGVAGRVLLVGFVANPYALMARASLFVLSSEREGFPNALVESMCLGTPVVATHCNHGPLEILDPGMQAGIRGVHLGQYGILVPEGDVPALTNAMEQVLSDAELAAHYGRKGRQRAEDFTVDATVSQFAGLVREALGAPQPWEQAGAALLQAAREQWSEAGHSHERP